VSPIIDSTLFDLLVIALILGPPAALGLYAWLEHVIARRAEEQLRGEVHMRRGFKAIARRRRTFEDTQ
jgi:hypothetical protein